MLIHGYPLNGHSWERQERELLDAGYRVINYDRRGFGLSSQPTTGYDYDTFAADLNALLDHLALDDVVLVGLLDGDRRGDPLPRHVRLGPRAQGGAVRRDPAVPAEDRRQPRGRRRVGLRGHQGGDRQAIATPTSRTSSTTSTTSTSSRGTRISDQAWQASFNVAAGASPYATYACVDTWLTDFREDLEKIDVPTLVVHGTEDRILPFDVDRGAAARN